MGWWQEMRLEILAVPLRKCQEVQTLSSYKWQHERGACQIRAECWKEYSDGANEREEEPRCFQTEKENI